MLLFLLSCSLAANGFYVGVADAAIAAVVRITVYLAQKVTTATTATTVVEGAGGEVV